MDLTREIRRTFERAIAAYAKSQNLVVAYENVPTNPAGAGFLSTALMPANTAPGVMAAARQQGIFQITIYTEINKGPGKADELAAGLMALFMPGKIGIVACGHVGRSGGYVVEGRYAVVVSVPYFVIE